MLPSQTVGLPLPQVLEVLADDSNFRGDAMRIIAGPAAAALSLPRRAFEAAWCAGEYPLPLG